MTAVTENDFKRREDLIIGGQKYIPTAASRRSPRVLTNSLLSKWDETLISRWLKRRNSVEIS